MSAPSDIRILCAIPVYNQAQTLLAVVKGCCAQMTSVLIVDDGSTDVDVKALLSQERAVVLRHERNQGKGMALRTAFTYAREQGFTHVITLDADGQHDPDDLPLFEKAIQAQPEAIVLGVRDFNVPNVPKSSQFGRSFSNFWVVLETGVTCADTQCGYRAYPLKYLSQLKLIRKRYDFEIEVLVRGLWGGLPLAEIPVRTHYPPADERVSHFNKWKDNFWLTHMHVFFVLRRLLPIPMKRWFPREKTTFWNDLLHPVAFIKRLIHEHVSPLKLGISAGVGTFIAFLPIPFHTVVILYVTTRLNLNRIMGITIQNLFMPPFGPGFAICVGHLILHGSFIPSYDWTPDGQGLLHFLKQFYTEWVVGALVVAPLFGVLFGWLTYRIAERVRKRHEEGATKQKARGNALGFWFFRATLRLTGLRGAYGLLYIVCAHYALFDAEARAKAVAYLSRRFPKDGALKRLFHVYLLFVTQGKCLIDAYTLNAGLKRFSFESEQVRTHLRELQGQGFLLLLSHVGGWQSALPFLRMMAGEQPVSLLMNEAESVEVRRHVRSDDGGFHVILPTDGPGCVVEMVMRLQRGEIVSIMGDRAYGGQTAAVQFLGAEAYFPVSAFAVARAATCPVVVLFVPKRGITSYCLEVARIDLDVTDRTAIRTALQRYADLLTDFTQRYPLQCFLFHDVWKK
jgi:predicted LPLAT superfamily acyltransferase/glycosyltransferase involved in cell wall biosynthesis